MVCVRSGKSLCKDNLYTGRLGTDRRRRASRARRRCGVWGLGSRDRGLGIATIIELGRKSVKA